MLEQRMLELVLELPASQGTISRMSYQNLMLQLVQNYPPRGFGSGTLGTLGPEACTPFYMPSYLRERIVTERSSCVPELPAPILWFQDCLAVWSRKYSAHPPVPEPLHSLISRTPAV